MAFICFVWFFLASRFFEGPCCVPPLGAGSPRNSAVQGYLPKIIPHSSPKPTPAGFLGGFHPRHRTRLQPMAPTVCFARLLVPDAVWLPRNLSQSERRGEQPRHLLGRRDEAGLPLPVQTVDVGQGSAKGTVPVVLLRACGGMNK